MLHAHVDLDKDGNIREQSIEDHSKQTAVYASQALSACGLSNTGFLAGILHDSGKCTKKFDTYLLKSFAGEHVQRGSVIHSFTGAIYVLETYHKGAKDSIQKLTAEIIAYAIGAHHGLFDCVNESWVSGFNHRLEVSRDEICYDEAIEYFLNHVISKSEIDELFKTACNEISALYQQLLTYSQKSNRNQARKIFYSQLYALVRMILSAVIYGDRRDTAEFMNCVDSYAAVASWTECVDYFENKIKGFSSNTDLNSVRADISRQCMEAANRSNGIYTLHVPTGGGKTLGMMRFALHHAKKYHKQRIIFIIPLLSILDQNVQVIREYLPDWQNVFEHHSNVVQDRAQTDQHESIEGFDLVEQTWNSPVIVSTLVQLLNIFFDERTSAISRLQALNDSVILIDEIQTIPRKMIYIVNTMINFLSLYCNATVVLSSATQPTLNKVDVPLNYADKSDIVTLSIGQKRVFKRSSIINSIDPYGMDIDELGQFVVELMNQKTSLLIICNTRSEARQLYNSIAAQQVDFDLFHLSTNMCKGHRADVLNQLIENLRELQKGNYNKKMICISTQLVEAGVDFSFECVIRILAGLDNLAQAAGRCNRSWEYNKGTVYFVRLRGENLSMLQDIKHTQDAALQAIHFSCQHNKDLLDEIVSKQYFQFLYSNESRNMMYPVQVKRVLNTTLFDLIANDAEQIWTGKKYVDGYILHYPMREIGKRFTVFAQDTIDVLVPYKKGKTIIDDLISLDYCYQNNGFVEWEKIRRLLEEAKEFTINLFNYEFVKLKENSQIYGLFYEHTKKEYRIYYLDDSVYDIDVMGVIKKEDADAQKFIL